MASKRKQREQESTGTAYTWAVVALKKGFWTPGRIGFSLAVLVMLIGILALYPKKGEDRSADAVAATSSPSAARPRSRMRGRTPLTEFPDGVMSSQIEMTKGKPIKLDQLNGKVVVVNLWATWCGPCRIEIPHLVELSNEFKNKGVEVVGLTTEEKSEAADAVTQFVQNYQIPYAIGWANEQIQRAVLGNSPSIPQSIIIGKDGKIFRHLIGFNPQLTPPQLRSAVEEALSQ